jgi:protein-S-isoprenylcysteine O-methyltransferase Ste14
MAALDLRVPPPLIGALLASAMWWAAPFGAYPPLPAPLRLALVVLLAVIGIGFDLAGIAAFRTGRTTVNPLKPERTSALMTGGVYRLTRNPMYVGMAFLLTAWAVQLGAFAPCLGPVLFVLYITRFQIMPEERVLAGKFGRDYADYRARTRRWL